MEFTEKIIDRSLYQRSTANDSEPWFAVFAQDEGDRWRVYMKDSRDSGSRLVLSTFSKRKARRTVDEIVAKCEEVK